MASLRFMWIVCLVCISTINLTTGARKKSKTMPDFCSSIYNEQQTGTMQEYYRRVREPEKHISTRLVRYFTFGGILQAISEETGIPRDTLVAGGASEFQDQSSGLGQAVHASHIIRVGAINSKLEEKNELLNRALQNYIGHTQNVLRVVNIWDGIGGAIDRFQSDNLSILATIDFSGLFNDNLDTVTELRDTFRNVIDEYVRADTSDKSKKKILLKDKETVYMVQECILFANGAEGYDLVMNGTFVEYYNTKRNRIN